MKRGGRSASKKSAAAAAASSKPKAPVGPRLARARVAKGAAAAHRAQSFFEVNEDDDDVGGRVAAMEDAYGDEMVGGYDDLPAGFDDEEIDEDEAFTEEDRARYGDIAFESFGKRKGGKRKGGKGGKRGGKGGERAEFDEDDEDDEVLKERRSPRERGRMGT
eukprot:5703-Pelagococcus_subviridis.AAC.1